VSVTRILGLRQQTTLLGPVIKRRLPRRSVLDWPALALGLALSTRSLTIEPAAGLGLLFCFPVSPPIRPFVHLGRLHLSSVHTPLNPSSSSSTSTFTSTSITTHLSSTSPVDILPLRILARGCTFLLLFSNPASVERGDRPSSNRVEPLFRDHHSPHHFWMCWWR
jgi:hypothetical protein